MNKYLESRALVFENGQKQSILKPTVSTGRRGSWLALPVAHALFVDLAFEDDRAGGEYGAGERDVIETEIARERIIAGTCKEFGAPLQDIGRAQDA